MADAAAALDIAQKVVETVAALALPHASSSLGRVTVSIGVTMLLSPDSTA